MGSRKNDTSVSKRRSRQGLRACLGLLLLVFVFATTQSLPAQNSPAPTRLVVRDTLGLGNLLNLCNLLGCSVDHGLGDPSGQLFLVKIPALLAPLTSNLMINLNLGVISVELDQNVQTLGASRGPAPSYLTDKTPVNYYGTTVWRGYITQPAVKLIRSSVASSSFNATGSGVVVAVIDTGVDPNHPVLKNVLLTGYDFTRNQSGGSEMGDINQSTVAVLDSDDVGQVSQSTVAVLDQSTVAVLDGNPKYAAFGHGTMTSGIVHLVAPQAKILPLKAFQASGNGYESDILSAIYYATNHGAKVINMSFDFTTYSKELENAVNYATANGVICVAAAGNSGEQTKVYPGALKNVIDVASTGDNDIRSNFTNYGAPPVWLAAPGEGVMTTYPFGTYAAGWGTSFSAPLVSGTSALLASLYGTQVNSQSSLSLGSLSLSFSSGASANLPSRESQAATALTHTQPVYDNGLGHGRLDTYRAVQDWRQSLGLH